MKQDEVDGNFKLKPLPKEDSIEWIKVPDERISLYGVSYDEEHSCFRRLDQEKAKKVNEYILWLSSHTSGGRIKFKTDSPYLAIKVIAPSDPIWPNIAPCSSHGCSVYDGASLIGVVGPDYLRLNDVVNNSIAYNGTINFISSNMHDVTIFMPSYNGVNEMYIGIKKGSTIEKNNYHSNKKIVFYGSSITQGANASRGGNDYAALISRWADVDYKNFGFSGRCKGELIMAHYIKEEKPNLIIVEYDYNASTIEELEKSHYAFYKELRKLMNNVPIIFFSRANSELPLSKERMEIIKNTYIKAKEENDKNIHFIDGSLLFGESNRDLCTVDGIHPSDIGFYRMACYLFDYIKKNDLL